MKKSVFCVLLFCLVFLSHGFAAEKDRAKIDDIVRRHLEPVVGKEKPVFGCAAGVVYGDTVCRYGFGRIDDEGDVVPNEKTVYEIASVTKLFTGLLLADMVVREEVKLEDHLADLLPSGYSLPQKSDRAITLLDIAEHRSGLPRLTPNFWAVANQTPGDPYTLFTREKVYESLALWKPRFEPQERYEYSNYAFSLLGNVIAAKKGKTFEELLGERVLKPLGMNDTKTVLDESLQKRLAPPHDAEGKLCKNWDLSTGFAPGGGLRSTLDDMLNFAVASTGQFDLLDKKLDDSQKEILDKAFILAQTPRADGVGEGRKIGLAWNKHEAGNFHWHNGQTGGYFSMFILDRENKVAVVILSNSFNASPDSIAVKILGELTRE